MEQVHVKEVNSEVLVFLDKHMGDKLNALREAAKIIQREIIRAEFSGVNRNNDSH